MFYKAVLSVKKKKAAELFLAKDKWFLICNLGTETYSEKTGMLRFFSLHLRLVLHSPNPAFFLVSPS